MSHGTGGMQLKALQHCTALYGTPPRMLAKDMPAAQSMLSAIPAGHALTCNVPVELVSDDPPPVPADTSSSILYARYGPQTLHRLQRLLKACMGQLVTANISVRMT